MYTKPKTTVVITDTDHYSPRQESHTNVIGTTTPVPVIYTIDRVHPPRDRYLSYTKPKETGPSRRDPTTWWQMDRMSRDTHDLTTPGTVRRLRLTTITTMPRDPPVSYHSHPEVPALPRPREPGVPPYVGGHPGFESFTGIPLRRILNHPRNLVILEGEISLRKHSRGPSRDTIRLSDTTPEGTDPIVLRYHPYTFPPIDDEWEKDLIPQKYSRVD